MARKAFGGIRISFKTVAHYELKNVLGTEPMTPAEMIKKLWAFIKLHDLRVS